MTQREWMRRAALVGAVAAALAIIVAPDLCDGLPEWLAWLLGCPCSSGNCSGAN